MTGTHVTANQGGCTCWCDDCGETHNCESWPQAKTLAWIAGHPDKCVIGRQKRISSALADLRENGVPRTLLNPIGKFAKALGDKK